MRDFSDLINDVNDDHSTGEIERLNSKVNNHQDILFNFENKLNSHEEELKLIHEYVDNLQNKFSNIGQSTFIGSSGEPDDQMYPILRKLQQDLDSIKSQNTIFSSMGKSDSSSEVNDNIMGAVLSEINKIRSQMDNYVNQKDYEKE